MALPVVMGEVGDAVGMARGYRLVEREQGFLLPVDMREWLGPEEPVWFVLDSVAVMDTSAFHRTRPGRRTRRSRAGRAGYDPDMLLALLIYAYAVGVLSSRRIERLCRTDVAFRVVCGNDVPDHTVIARFRQRNLKQFQELFREVLRLCAAARMGDFTQVALDGTKIAANASMAANRSPASLLAEVERRVEAAQVVDAAEAEAARHGQGPANTPRALRDHDARRAALTRLQQDNTRAPEQEVIAGLAESSGVAPSTDTDGEPTDTDDTADTDAGNAGTDTADPGDGPTDTDTVDTDAGNAGTDTADPGDGPTDTDTVDTDAGNVGTDSDESGSGPTDIGSGDTDNSDDDATTDAEDCDGGNAGTDAEDCDGRNAGTDAEDCDGGNAGIDADGAAAPVAVLPPVRLRRGRDAVVELEFYRDLLARAQAEAEQGTDVRNVEIAKLAARAGAALMYYETVRTRHEGKWAQYQAEVAAGRRVRGFAPVPTEKNVTVGKARRRYRKARARWVAALTPVEEGGLGKKIRVNTTDPDSKLVKTARGYVQGFNAQTVVSSDYLLLSVGVTPSSADTASYIPMVEDAVATVTALWGPDAVIGLVSADAGYCSEANLTAPGPDRVIATGNRHRDPDEEPEHPYGKAAIAAMRERLATAEGRALYKRRGALVEPVNAHLKDQRGLRRFSMRGLHAATGELNLAAATTNLMRLRSFGLARPTAA